jgi:hypothetical protein
MVPPASDDGFHFNWTDVAEMAVAVTLVGADGAEAPPVPKVYVWESKLWPAALMGSTVTVPPETVTLRKS